MAKSKTQKTGKKKSRLQVGKLKDAVKDLSPGEKKRVKGGQAEYLQTKPSATTVDSLLPAVESGIRQPK